MLVSSTYAVRIRGNRPLGHDTFCTCSLQMDHASQSLHGLRIVRGEVKQITLLRRRGSAEERLPRVGQKEEKDLNLWRKVREG